MQTIFSMFRLVCASRMCYWRLLSHRALNTLLSLSLTLSHLLALDSISRIKTVLWRIRFRDLLLLIWIFVSGYHDRTHFITLTTNCESITTAWSHLVEATDGKTEITFGRCFRFGFELLLLLLEFCTSWSLEYDDRGDRIFVGSIFYWWYEFCVAAATGSSAKIRLCASSTLNSHEHTEIGKRKEAI